MSHIGIFYYKFVFLLFVRFVDKKSLLPNGESHIVFFLILIIILLGQRKSWSQSFIYLYIKTDYKLLSGETFGPAGSISWTGLILEEGGVGGSGYNEAYYATYTC